MSTSPETGAHRDRTTDTTPDQTVQSSGMRFHRKIDRADLGG